MTREQLLDELTLIARDVFNMPELVLSDSLSASDVETWTSLTFMQFLTNIETKYQFRFKIMELLCLKNMGAVVDATLNHINE